MKRIFLLAVMLSYAAFDYAAANDAPKEIVGAIPDTTQLYREWSEHDFTLFAQPPRAFYPETWFHFINGNVSKEGVAKDLKAIADAGITGISFFHGQMGDNTDWPGTTEHIECLSPHWEQLLSYTASEANRLGLRFTMQTCPGWAMSGGPWIKPSQSMRQLVSQRILVKGGETVSHSFPQPYSQEWRDYQTIALLAFPAPKGEAEGLRAPSKLRSDLPEDQLMEMLKRTPKGSIAIPPIQDHWHQIEIFFEEEETLRSLVFNPIDNFNHAHGVFPEIKVKMTAIDGEGRAHPVLDSQMPNANWQDNEATMTFALNEHPSRHYCLYIQNAHPMQLSDLRLSSAPRKNNWEMESAFTSRTLLPWGDELRQDAACYLDPGQILDLSNTLKPDGSFTWEAPAGEWVIMRFGHVCTGRQNGPAPREATGWEVNKFDPQAVEFQFNSYVGRLAEGALKGHVQNMLMDSWECATQTWTAGMPEEFFSFNRYELLPWLPALSGYVIRDPSHTAQFLSDWRRCINHLFVENFYGTMARMAHGKGMTIQYETAAGDIFPGCPMEYYKYADVPMCEFWQPFSHWLASHEYKPIIPTASAAHLYGKPRVSAESFTSFALTWDEKFSMLRSVANANMVEGVSHFVFHTYTHNPAADSLFPGTSFGAAIGTPFLRKQTWWPYLKHFNSYLARCTYMLERGKSVKDVLYYLGDEIQQKPSQTASFPKGYQFDYLNQDVLLHRLEVKDGQFVTPEGLTFKMLWIPDRCRRLSMETMERLLEFTEKGGVVVAKEPVESSRLLPNEEARTAFASLKSRLFNAQNSTLYSQESLEEVLEKIHLKPDVKNHAVKWVHRKTDTADWYMVTTLPDTPLDTLVELRAKGQAYLLNPMNGKVHPLNAVTTQEGYTSLHLKLAPNEVVFILLTEKQLKPKGQTIDRMHTALSVKPSHIRPADFKLSFAPGWGIDHEVSLPSAGLVPWKSLDTSQEGKAYSGTCLYTSSVTLDRYSPKRTYLLDLGRVEHIAQVKVNGETVDTLWAAPYTSDITAYLKKGVNKIEIAVTSTWRNRLIYDASLPEEERKTWVIAGPGKTDELAPYGLLGPVDLKIY